MIRSILSFFKTGRDRPLFSKDPQKIIKSYNYHRWSVFLSITLGYGFFYICRLSFSVAKKPMLDANVMDAKQMGIVGAAMLAVYAVGKFTNGFLADRANIRKFMSMSLLASAVINLLFGFSSLFIGFVILWCFNGWFQSVGSAPSIVALCQWFHKKERGTWYGIWAAAHNIGEGLTFLGTSALIGWLGWRWGFWGPGIVCAVISLIMLKTLSDRPRTLGLPDVEDFKSEDFPENIKSQDFDNQSIKSETCKKALGKMQLEVLKSPVIWFLGLASAMMYIVRYAINNWGILYLQEVKGHSLIQAGIILSYFPIAGIFGASVCGYMSDKIFNSNRNYPTLIYGLINVVSLIGLFYCPIQSKLLDSTFIALFGFSIGGLIVFLAGLTALDFFPNNVAGAVKGVIGIFSYIGAAFQDLISGFLIDSGKTIVDGQVIYNFDKATYFWVGASMLSIIFASLIWKMKPNKTS